jgi:CBS domain-containing protein
MQIAEILGYKGVGVIALRSDTAMSEAALLLSEQAIGVAVVVDADDFMCGILSERDITRGLAQHGATVAQMRVEDLMTRDVVSCNPDCTVDDALALMRKHNIRHLPVIEEETHLIALISMRDLLDLEKEDLREAS